MYTLILLAIYNGLMVSVDHLDFPDGPTCHVARIAIEQQLKNKHPKVTIECLCVETF